MVQNPFGGDIVKDERGNMLLGKKEDVHMSSPLEKLDANCAFRYESLPSDTTAAF